MTYDWHGYYDIAVELLGGEPISTDKSETEYRVATSRLYYSVFILARNYLRDCEDRDDIGKNKDDHFNVPYLFKADKDKENQVIGYNLDRLRKLRNNADYDDNIHNPLNMAEKALNNASEVITRIDVLIASNSDED